MKSQVYLLIFTLAIAITATVSKSQPVGGYFPIKDLEDPYVIGIAEFAISEYNKMAMTNLELISILKGEEQVVAGKNYKLVLAATDGLVTGNYLTIVYDRPWEHYRSLTEFSKLSLAKRQLSKGSHWLPPL
ncbi:cysteine proteinase inhibitor 1-like [Tripterygium wilfordii]|uniref:cysteine proteinase inhibitor 1-like n=1 Tax=Tripterygium wilfordii TaxID=458696 RepID=UPI0018F847F5|nr:cysteine proteinase inhibitor 1-like [Tripterygium wilfordii]